MLMIEFVHYINIYMMIKQIYFITTRGNLIDERRGKLKRKKQNVFISNQTKLINEIKIQLDLDKLIHCLNSIFNNNVYKS